MCVQVDTETTRVFLAFRTRYGSGEPIPAPGGRKAFNKLPCRRSLNTLTILPSSLRAAGSDLIKAPAGSSGRIFSRTLNARANNIAINAFPYANNPVVLSRKTVKSRKNGVVIVRRVRNGLARGETASIILRVFVTGRSPRIPAVTSNAVFSVRCPSPVNYSPDLHMVFFSNRAQRNCKMC